MVAVPAGVVGTRSGLLMAGDTGILLVTHEAPIPIKGRLTAVRFHAPHVVVRPRLLGLMTLPTTIRGVTNRAGVVRLRAERAM